jgi:hypothetical protein
MPQREVRIMIIRLADRIALELMTAWHATRGKEFSGFGFCERKEGELYVYDYVLLDVGSEVWTEIDPEVLLPLLERADAANMKVWLHAHPVGNGKPGQHNWSGTDTSTILSTPLGGVPEMVKWSASIVLTPGGWVGRVDNYLKKKTVHCEVFPQTPVYGAVNSIKSQKKKIDIFELAVQAADQFSLEEMEDLGMNYDDLVEYLEVSIENGDLMIEDLDELYYRYTDTSYLYPEEEDEWIEQDTWRYSTQAKRQLR